VWLNFVSFILYISIIYRIMSVKSALGLKQSSGQIGQQITSYLPTANVSIPAGPSSGNLLTITLPAGVWNVQGLAWIQFALATDFTSGYVELYLKDSAGTSYASNTTANPTQGEIWTETQNQFKQLGAVIDVDVETTFVLYYNIDYASGVVLFEQGSGGVGTGIVATRLA
jgi:hypothetical protein